MYTGRMYEEDFVGSVEITPDFEEAERRLQRHPSGRYLRVGDLYNLIKKFQPADPTHPTKELARELRLEVADALGLSERDLDRVKFYTAVKTPLDYKFGVDAFIEFEDPATGRTLRTTIDLTLRKEKAEEQYGKADVIIGELPDPETDEYTKAVEDIAHDIAVKLQRAAAQFRPKHGGGQPQPQA